MCKFCKYNQDTIDLIEQWADDGMPCASMEVLARPTAEDDPNTYVFVFKNALHVQGAMRDVFLDVHYQGATIAPGAARKAFGGLWMKGVQGDMKPEQHRGPVYRQAHIELPRRAPGIVDGTFGANVPVPLNVKTELQHHQDKVRVTGTFLPGRL
jgi:hypothetical protein